MLELKLNKEIDSDIKLYKTVTHAHTQAHAHTLTLTHTHTHTHTHTLSKKMSWQERSSMKLFQCFAFFKNCQKTKP